MALESDIKEALLKRLKNENLLSADSAEQVIAALEKDSQVNWNVILNREIQPSKDDETPN